MCPTSSTQTHHVPVDLVRTKNCRRLSESRTLEGFPSRASLNRARSSVRGDGGPSVALLREREALSVAEGSSGVATGAPSSRPWLSRSQFRVNPSASVIKYVIPYTGTDSPRQKSAGEAACVPVGEDVSEICTLWRLRSVPCLRAQS